MSGLESYQNLITLLSKYCQCWTATTSWENRRGMSKANLELYLLWQLLCYPSKRKPCPQTYTWTCVYHNKNIVLHTGITSAFIYQRSADIPAGLRSTQESFVHVTYIGSNSRQEPWLVFASMALCTTTALENEQMTIKTKHDSRPWRGSLSEETHLWASLCQAMA